MEERRHQMGELCPVNIPIQMICAVDTSGRISPMRFRFETQEHSLETVNIDGIISRGEKNYVGIREQQFICRARVGNMAKTLEIRMNVDSQKWRIFQFLS